MSEAAETRETDWRRLVKALGVFLANIKPDGIPDGVVEWILQNPVEATCRLVRFLKNGCHFVIVGPKALVLPNEPFDPAKFFGDGRYTVWKGPKNGNGLEGVEERDAREDALAHVDFSHVSLEICLEAGEAPITGEEKLIRLRALVGKILLGGKTFQALWGDYQTNRADSILEWLYVTHGNTYFDLPGLVLRDPSGGRCVLYVCRRSDGSWSWGCHWLGGGRGAGSHSAALAK